MPRANEHLRGDVFRYLAVLQPEWGVRATVKGAHMAQGREDQAAPASVRSFLVADIRGYTAYTAAHGDEAAATLVEHFAGMVSDGVTAWAGTLVELRGDEALAAFESPRSAVRAAAELQAAFDDESHQYPDLPLRVGIGLDAGEAVPVGAVAVAAAPGEMRTQGPAATLGTPTSIPPQLDPVVPLAGRQRELGWLRWHWRRVRHGHTRSVVISGIPGIGKTRLAAAVAAVAPCQSSLDRRR